MSRVITALFDHREDADAGAERLRQAGIDVSNVKVHDKSSHATSDRNSTHEEKGLWASIKGAFLPDEDRHTYEEGIRRGGFLLTAEVDDDATGTAVAALEEAKSVDLDERSTQWRNDGWTGRAGAATTPQDEAGLYGVRDLESPSTRYRSYSPRGI